MFSLEQRKNILSCHQTIYFSFQYPYCAEKKEIELEIEHKIKLSVKGKGYLIVYPCQMRQPPIQQSFACAGPSRDTALEQSFLHLQCLEHFSVEILLK